MKLWIALSWWWMKASFAVGVMKFIAEQNFQIQYIIAWSGSAWTAAYFQTRQYEEMVRIRSNNLTTKQFIDPLRLSKILDIDYLIDEIFQKQVPLDWGNISKRESIFEIAVTNTQRWKVNFLQIDSNNIFDALRATKAIPFVYWKRVNVEWTLYQDGSNSTWWELMAQRLLEKWCTKVIIIDNWVMFSKWLVHLYWAIQNPHFHKEYIQEYNERIALRKLYYSDPRIVIIRPSREIDFGLLWILNNNQETLKQNIEHGYLVAKDSLIKELI